MELQEILKEELKTAWRLMAVMNVQSEEEFVAVVLPNLHSKVYELLSKQISVNKKYTCNKCGDDVEDCESWTVDFTTLCADCYKEYRENCAYNSTDGAYCTVHNCTH